MPLTTPPKQSLERPLGCAQAGWGFSGGVLMHVFACSLFLGTLRLGLGAGVGDRELAALAAACPYLRCLELRFAHVSDAGARPGAWA